MDMEHFHNAIDSEIQIRRAYLAFPTIFSVSHTTFPAHPTTHNYSLLTTNVFTCPFSSLYSVSNTHETGCGSDL